MSDDDKPAILTADEAIAMLPEGAWVHTFSNPFGGMMIGADWSREHVIEAIRAGTAELSGATATRMNHGIALRTSAGRRLFVETKKPAPGVTFEEEVDRS